jgi:hypothetical protein
VKNKKPGKSFTMSLFEAALEELLAPQLPNKSALSSLKVHELLQKHQDPPRISFFIFSRLVPIGKTYVARPAGMWGALDLDHALEAATRQYPPGERILLRLEFVLPDPPACPNVGQPL